MSNECRVLSGWWAHDPGYCSMSRLLQHILELSVFLCCMLQTLDPQEQLGQGSLFPSQFTVTPTPSPRQQDGAHRSPSNHPLLLLPTRTKTMMSLVSSIERKVAPPGLVQRRGRAKPFCPVQTQQQGMWPLQHSRSAGVEGSSNELPYPGTQKSHTGLIQGHNAAPSVQVAQYSMA